MKNFSIPFLLIVFGAICSVHVRAQAPVFNTIIANSSSIPKNEKFELTVNLTAGFTNPYDYNDIVVTCTFTSPANKVETVEGFYMQNYTLDAGGNLTPSGNGVFKVRFTPREIGSYTYKISCTNLQGSAESNANSFNATAPSAKGFVIRGGGNYLMYDDNTGFFPIGLNMGWQNGSVVDSYTSWLNKLSANGGNFIRVWMSSWAFALEWQNGNNGYEGLKKYKQQNAFYLDWLVDKCAEKNVYIMLCLNNHGQVSSNVNPEWNSNPYKASNGGPATNTWDFFTNTTANDLHKNRLRYIIARYGYSTHIQSWELFNEVDWTDQFDAHKTDISNWHKEMADYIKTKDIYKHLVTTSYAHDNVDDVTWNLANIDFTQTHFYNSSPNLENLLVNGVRDYSKFSKPTINGEFGLNTDGNNLTAMDPNGIHLHNAIWATSFSGAMGAAMTWWWDNYVDPQNLFYHYKPLSSVVSLFNVSISNYQAITAQVAGGGAADLVVQPGADWGLAPAGNFTIDAAAAITPSASSLSKYLYGSSYNTQYRNPPTFSITYPVAGQFKVFTGGNMGTTPKISIYVDGILQLNVDAATGANYAVNLTAGAHTIKVDNLGTDWIEISSYNFSNFGSPLSTYCLQSAANKDKIGYILNKQYNWQYFKDHNSTPPPVVNGATVTLPGNNTGSFMVQFYDCETGLPTTTINNIVVANAPVSFNLPPLAWDLAFRVMENGSLPIKLAAFYGKSEITTNKLYIDIQQSDNVKSITVERSADAINFSALGNVLATNNLFNGKHDFVDVKPLNGGNWYRLKTTDNNGTVSYSGVVYLTHVTKGVVSFYPNPVKEKLFVNMVGANSGKYNIVIADINGRKVQTQSIETKLANELNAIPFTPTTKGIYLVTITDASGALVAKQKLVK